MAKINKYWGLVAVGALTAAAAGVIAAVFMKKDSCTCHWDCEDDTDEDFDIPADFNEEDVKETEKEDFASWDNASPEQSTEEAPQEEADEASAEDAASEDTASASEDEE